MSKYSIKTILTFITLIFNILNPLRMHVICYMAPKTVLTLLPAMHSTIISNANTTNNNNILTLPFVIVVPPQQFLAYISKFCLD